MDKPAQADHPICDLVRDRWSPRAFSDKPLPVEEIASLFEAARWAPSCFNDQPWSFLIADKRNKDQFDKMLACLSSWNQRWAAGAPLLLLAVARLSFKRNNKANRHAAYDLGQSVATLTCQATSMGLRVHQMGGFSREKVRSTYEIPEGFEPLTAIAVGYPGDPLSLPDDLQEQEMKARERSPISNFVFEDRFKKKVF